jgi:hypothetical protein
LHAYFQRFRAYFSPYLCNLLIINKKFVLKFSYTDGQEAERVEAGSGMLEAGCGMRDAGSGMREA